MRNLRKYSTGVNFDFTNNKFEHINNIKFNLSDLMISVLVDKRFSSTEKGILGVIFDETFNSSDVFDMGNNEKVNVEYIASDIKIKKDTIVNISEQINTKFLSDKLETTSRTIFTNLHSLIDKGIIEFKREKFSEYGRIKLNLGFLVTDYYKWEVEK